MEDSPAADGGIPTNSMIPSPGLLPSYLATAFGELYEEDGLMVMAKGLGWMSLLASFVRFYADVEEGHASLLVEEPTRSSSCSHGTSSSRKPPLVLVLGLRQVEHEALLSILDSWGTPHHMMPKSITNESGQGKDRLGTPLFASREDGIYGPTDSPDFSDSTVMGYNFFVFHISFAS